MSDTTVDQFFLGVIVPYDFALDREVWRWTPKRVTLLITRTPQLGLPSTVSMAESISNDETVAGATRQLLTTKPDAVVYLCTSGSFIRGAEGERQMRQVMRAAGAPAAVTTAGALVEACQALGTSRLAVATPYIDSVTSRLRTFLRESDIDVVSSIGLGREERIWQVTEEHIRDLVLAADRPDADAIFISCTNLRTYTLIRELEADLGKPVLTANQVSIWSALRAAGIKQPDIKQRLFIETWPGRRRREHSETAVSPFETQGLALHTAHP